MILITFFAKETGFENDCNCVLKMIVIVNEKTTTNSDLRNFLIFQCMIEKEAFSFSFQFYLSTQGICLRLGFLFANMAFASSNLKFYIHSIFRRGTFFIHILCYLKLEDLCLWTDFKIFLRFDTPLMNN